MTNETVMSIVRHILTFGGGLAVGKGWMDEGTMTQVVGAAVTLVGAIWAIVNKKKLVNMANSSTSANL